MCHLTLRLPQTRDTTDLAAGQGFQPDSLHFEPIHGLMKTEIPIFITVGLFVAGQSVNLRNTHKKMTKEVKYRNLRCHKFVKE